MTFRLAKYFVVAVASVACIVPALAVASTSALEWEFVVHKKIEKVVQEGRCFVFVSGLSGMSAKAVSRVDVTVENSSAAINVQMKLVSPASSAGGQSSGQSFSSPFAGPGSSNSFEVMIPLRKPEVRQILFGAGKAVIWKGDGTKNDCENK